MGLTIATYNVKDLFDSVDEPSELHLDRKLDVLAGVIRTVDADVLALQEVSSEAVLDRLRERLPHAGSQLRYDTRIVGSADARGIRCALLSRLPVRASKVHTAEKLDFPRFRETDPAPFGARIPLRRGIVHAEVDGGPFGTVHVLVLHFKSVRPVPLRAASGAPLEPETARERAEGELRTMVWRASEALFVRGIVDDLFAQHPGHSIVVTGDFNDVPGSTTLRIVSGDGRASSSDDAEVTLHSAADAIETERFSVLHRGRHLEIDHMLTSAGLRARVASARFFNGDLRDHGLLAEGEVPTPDSDHAPLVVRFQ